MFQRKFSETYFYFQKHLHLEELRDNGLVGI